MFAQVNNAQNLPADTKQALQYLDLQVKELIRWRKELDASLKKVVYAAPAKPREGDFVFADGTTWNPGSGRGLYQYLSGVWVPLAGTGTPSATVADLDGTSVAGVSSDYSRGDHKHADAARHEHANKVVLDAVTSTIYLSCALVSKPTAGQVVMLLAVPYAFTFAANFGGSAGSVGANPTGSAVYTVKKNGSDVGTVTISVAGAFTFATSGGAAVDFSANDRLSIIAPSPADATLSDVIIELSATRG